MQQSERYCFDRPIHDTEEGHTSHNSNIEKHTDRIRRQPGHPIRYTGTFTAQYLTEIRMRHLSSRNRALEY